MAKKSPDAGGNRHRGGFWSPTQQEYWSPVATVTSYMVTASGEVCQRRPRNSHSCSGRTSPHPISMINPKGFLGGVPVNTETSASENPAGATRHMSSAGWQRCLFFIVAGGVGLRVPRHLYCGHRSRAGCLSANQAMPVQFRLIAPIFKITRPHHMHGGRQPAQQSLQNFADPGQHRDAVPFVLEIGPLD